MTDAATTVTAVLPLWLEIIVAVLVLAGAALALLAAALSLWWYGRVM